MVVGAISPLSIYLTACLAWEHNNPLKYVLPTFVRQICMTNGFFAQIYAENPLFWQLRFALSRY